MHGMFYSRRFPLWRQQSRESDLEYLETLTANTEQRQEQSALRVLDGDAGWNSLITAVGEERDLTPGVADKPVME